VFGSGHGTGVKGSATSPSGVGVFAANTGGGLAFTASGRVAFSTAGAAMVAPGTKKVTVVMAGVGPLDLVLATVQSPGAFYVRNAVPATGKLTITINKSAAATPVRVAYFVITPP
jgi:hypothetical protein